MRLLQYKSNDMLNGETISLSVEGSTFVDNEAISFSLSGRNMKRDCFVTLFLTMTGKLHGYLICHCERSESISFKITDKLIIKSGHSQPVCHSGFCPSSFRKIPDERE